MELIPTRWSWLDAQPVARHHKATRVTLLNTVEGMYLSLSFKTLRDLEFAELNFFFADIKCKRSQLANTLWVYQQQRMTAAQYLGIA